ncbi:unnamed protein product [Parnassius apollo]|uniref:(apollo) hypothetical protein n=1 Tax=Parnassius apollo TaxID=110799 RepID=A0A8S3XLE1_PARAO|nr:unnamed protein product [Parnassius apollo]
MGEVAKKLNIANILKSVVEEIKPDNIISGFKACGLYPFDENAINYTKYLATNNKGEESKEENKMISHIDFDSIIGEEIMSKMKVLQYQGVNVNSPTLYKLCSFFQGDFPLKESTNVEIQCPINTTTNVNLSN